MEVIGRSLIVVAAVRMTLCPGKLQEECSGKKIFEQTVDGSSNFDMIMPKLFRECLELPL
ncbi:hypothetical protein [Paenibacillus cymbidii]|uniref:hypothetical protein n=1 Tax=Paenibacillus cymbidii TaxID=1639034 RepID=UPI0010807BCC|nr:hypothetical protein [Paenibacillus cymbidii]